jgi:hypothetical protein
VLLFRVGVMDEATRGKCVNSAITERAATSDGFALVKAEGDTSINRVGGYRDLIRNWFALPAAVELTTAERIEVALFASKILYSVG